MLQLYLLVRCETGVRCNSEGLWLRWQDLDFERGFVAIESVRKGRRTKSGKSRRVPMTPRLREALQDHAARYRLVTYDGERSRWVFHHMMTQRGAVAGHRLQSFHRAFASAAKRAKLPADVTAHLRQHDVPIEFDGRRRAATDSRVSIGRLRAQRSARSCPRISDSTTSAIVGSPPGSRGARARS